MVWAHSWRDSILVALSLLEIALLIFSALMFEQLPWLALLGMGALIVFLTCTNFQCIAHNLIHTPFFRARWANAVFGVVNSIPLCLPQTLYRVYHLNHHAYNNDLVDPGTGTTKDYSSIYRYSKHPGRAEHILPYAFLSLLRVDLVSIYRDAARLGLARRVLVEAFAIAVFVAALGLLRPAWLLFYAPVYVLGQVAAYAENYLEHYGAAPGNRLTDSVSAYGWWYNLIWFNNGYHQEHHWRPNVHWTEVARLRAMMLPEEQRRVVKGAHWFNFGPVPDRLPVAEGVSAADGTRGAGAIDGTVET